jgi:hypothetical protein
MGSDSERVLSNVPWPPQPWTHVISGSIDFRRAHVAIGARAQAMRMP